MAEHVNLVNGTTIRLGPTDRELKVNEIAIESSRRGDGSFIEAGTVTSTNRPLTPWERLARSILDMAAELEPTSD